MSRSNWKPLLIDDILVNTNKHIKKTNSRSFKITKNLVGSNIQIHNGFRFFDLEVNNKMVGQKLGEFAPTRILHIHKKKNKKK